MRIRGGPFGLGLRGPRYRRASRAGEAQPSGAPTFLVELLERADTDLRELEGVKLPASDFADYRADPVRPIPVIYQSGYLTIRGYEPESSALHPRVSE